MAFPNKAKHESSRELLGQRTNGYVSAGEAKTNIIDYIIGYYSQTRPHQHNNGLAPNVAEKNYWTEYKTVAKKT